MRCPVCSRYACTCAEGSWRSAVAPSFNAAGRTQFAEPAAFERQARFAIGQPVVVPDTCQYFADWRGQTLWIAGVQFDHRKRRLDYTVSEHWPPRHNGDLSDGWAEEDLTASPQQREG